MLISKWRAKDFLANQKLRRALTPCSWQTEHGGFKTQCSYPNRRENTRTTTPNVISIGLQTRPNTRVFFCFPPASAMVAQRSMYSSTNPTTTYDHLETKCSQFVAGFLFVLVHSIRTFILILNTSSIALKKRKNKHQHNNRMRPATKHDGVHLNP